MTSYVTDRDIAVDFNSFMEINLCGGLYLINTWRSRKCIIPTHIFFGYPPCHVFNREEGCHKTRAYHLV